MVACICLVGDPDLFLILLRRELRWGWECNEMRILLRKGLSYVERPKLWIVEIATYVSTLCQNHSHRTLTFFGKIAVTTEVALVGGSILTKEGSAKKRGTRFYYRQQHSREPSVGVCPRQVLCTACHPYSLHLYERLGNGLTMTKDFCDEFYDACSGQLNLSSNYCNLHAGESEDEPPYWAYPLVIPGEQPEARR